MHIVLVYNAHSGSARQLDELRSMFNKAGFVIDDAIKIDRQIHSKLKKHVAMAATIAAVGGDGTISAVAQVVTGTKATLLPLPGGTLNHFTKDTGVVQSLEDAIEKAYRGRVRLVDAALVNDTVFINNSSIGLYPSSLYDRSRLEDRFGKWPAALAASIGALFRFRVYDIVIDKKSLTTPFVFIGNNKYDIQSGGMGRKKMDQGLLSVFVVQAKTRLDMLKILPFALVGRAAQHERFDVFTAKAVVINAKKHKRIRVSHDGEFTLMDTPLHYSVKSKSLRILS